MKILTVLTLLISMNNVFAIGELDCQGADKDDPKCHCDQVNNSGSATAYVKIINGVEVPCEPSSDDKECKPKSIVK